jgi:hypothetical protein
VIDATPPPDREAVVRVPRPMTVLSILSILLFAATAVDEHRSRARADGLLLQSPWVTVGWSSSAAKMELRFVLPREGENLAWNLTRRTFNRRGDVTPPDNMRLRGGGLLDWRAAGVTFQGGELHGKFAALTVPHVLLLAGFAVLPARWVFIRARRPHYLRLRGLCGRCGYDLRASTMACPECGEAIHSETAVVLA